MPKLPSESDISTQDNFDFDISTLLPRKRRRLLNKSYSALHDDDDEFHLNNSLSPSGLVNEEDDPQERRSTIPDPTRCFEIRQPQLIHPKSLYEGWLPPLPLTLECTALKDLLEAGPCYQASGKAADYVMFELSDFKVYRPEGRREFEMVPLHHLKVLVGCDELMFDGILTAGNQRRYVQGVPFQTMAVEGYCDCDLNTVAHNVSIQSKLGASKDVWYLLSKPATEYQRYHEPFLWVADLAKHVIDFIDDHNLVGLYDFHSCFHKWMQGRYGQNEAFQQWLSKFQRTDFRPAVAAYVGFLWKEAHSVNDQFGHEPLWKDLNYLRDDGGFQDPDEKRQPGTGKTVVTPFVYENFKHMPFTHILERIEPKTSRLIKEIQQRKQSLGLLDGETFQQIAERNIVTQGKTHIFEVGDVVVVSRDADSLWKDGSSTWFAYIQRIHKDNKGSLFDVIWLYSPAHTTLAGGNYRFPNELFLSDHCNCQDQALRTQDIVRKVHVRWVIKSAASAGDTDFEYFVRQKYDTDDHSFTTLKETDFTCACNEWYSDLEPVMRKYLIGDTVLVSPTQSSSITEPVVIVAFKLKSETVSVRRLLRRGRDLGDQAKSNELVWTEEVYNIQANLVQDKCHIRFYEETDQIPAPYSRNGTANCYFITSRLNQRHRLEALRAPFPSSLRQGFDPTAAPVQEPMAAMDLFCGGGNFGRGLAEAKAIECLWAIDWAKNAVCTYRANEDRSRKPRIYWGSVNDYLLGVLSGSQCQLIARVGDVDFIAAGSPCQAFSLMQRNKSTERSLRNASMVAAVAAYVDVYRPKYAYLENVVSMAHRGKKGGDTIFPQLLCALVGMGYQVQQFLVDAWSTGASQKRSRLFISIAAPGLVPVLHPALTHSHPAGIHNSALGVNSNAAKFGQRKFVPTPFHYVTAQESMHDLPYVGDSHVQTCIPFPDHRLCRIENETVQRYIKSVPVSPPGQSLVQAIAAGLVPKPLSDHFLAHSSKQRTMDTSRSYSRIPADGLIPTITTAPQPADAWTGRLLHWQQHRVLTVMEARRAQGFPDDEVIVGTPSAQWHIIGNSVDRRVAIALGMALREAWLSSSTEGDSPVMPGSPGSTADEDVEMTETFSVCRSSVTHETSKSITVRNRIKISTETTIQKTKRASKETQNKGPPRKVSADIIDLTEPSGDTGTTIKREESQQEKSKQEPIIIDLAISDED